MKLFSEIIDYLTTLIKLRYRFCKTDYKLIDEFIFGLPGWAAEDSDCETPSYREDSANLIVVRGKVVFI
jgi:hypothetical protein